MRDGHQDLDSLFAIDSRFVAEQDLGAKKLRLGIALVESCRLVGPGAGLIERSPVGVFQIERGHIFRRIAALRRT